MRILIEDKDIAVSQTAVFTSTIAAALYLSRINEDWKITAGIDEAAQKEWSRNAVRMVNVARQLHKGLLGPGDEVTFKFDGMKCAVSVLEDAGKHTGGPWVNAYAFGPWDALTSEDPFNRGGGWPNRVQESRPIPYGVGHSPDGTEY